MSALFKSRVRNKLFLSKFVENPTDVVRAHFRDKQHIGFSGFTGIGGPKVIPNALCEYTRYHHLNMPGDTERQMRFNLYVGASCGVEEDKMALENMIAKRTPHQVGKQIRKRINSGDTLFFDKNLSLFPQELLSGFYNKDLNLPDPTKTDALPSNVLDIAVIEATGIDEDGGIILGPSVGATPEFLAGASKIIIEINTTIREMKGLHDLVLQKNPPFRQPLMHTKVDQRLGSEKLYIDASKVVAVLESKIEDHIPENSAADENSAKIASHLIAFFKDEVKHNRMPKNLFPLQSGIGNVANSVIGGLANSGFKNLQVFTEVFQDSFLDLFANGSLDVASSTSIRLTPNGMKRLDKNWDSWSKKIILRPQTVSNNPELIRRLGVIAMNTPVEVDIYGHANSTCVLGSKMLNGIGGSREFLTSAKYSIMHTISARPTPTDPIGITSVVPFVSHVDQTEHDLDIFVTEQGLADLRGLAPRERALEIINKCAHPEYKPLLMKYYSDSVKRSNGKMHEPHDLHKCFEMYFNLEERGSMRAFKTGDKL
ncbi:Acetyl-CoA hydrolase [Hanseniaspora uvarum DSM 2768]|jgi:acetyl-CoA hydrolase|uniref:Acetyl-CoA hydrolase n=1 Tax=Hanseniaspora uvarum TaxID=29833 RepID=A0A1E5R6Z3_HANUV|nr:hypothetical protein FOG50_03493 [Hanseniaspora uvarum]KKA01434.1 Acetyl-CoA hydrolase [Hanseniaspora uvarum DSM 2768]OEJ82680.1 Acetyl-CoA hydrolase [Hanseniaspora uvarum]GMM42110.1 acetyl-CoA hydrolase [Hanseniaspora uvarum]